MSKKGVVKAVVVVRCGRRREKGVGRKRVESKEGVIQLGEKREVMSWDLIFLGLGL